MRFEVTVLGSCAAMPTPNKHHSAHALNVYEQFFLVDCGEGTQSRLMQCGINPLKINHIFISHLHGDHMYGLFPLLATMGMMGRRSALRIYAPAPFGIILEDHRRYFDVSNGFDVEWVEVKSSGGSHLVYDNSVMEVYTIPLRHSISCCGYLFREKRPPLNLHKWAVERYGLGVAQMVAAKRGEDVVLDSGEVVENSKLTYLPHVERSYAYCSDTQYSAKVAEIVKGVDLLYHEATFMDIDSKMAKKTGHSTASQAAKVAAMAGVGRLLIGHFSNRYKDVQPLVAEACEIFEQCEAVKEGMTYAIPCK